MRNCKSQTGGRMQKMRQEKVFGIKKIYKHLVTKLIWFKKWPIYPLQQLIFNVLTLSQRTPILNFKAVVKILIQCGLASNAIKQL